MLTFSLGYGCSNFRLLDGHPYTHSGYDLDEKQRVTHSAFVSIGLRF